MAINRSKSIAVAAQPLGTSAIVASGYSSAGGYDFPDTFSTGTYIVNILTNNTSALYSTIGADNNASLYVTPTTSMGGNFGYLRFSTTETRFSAVQYAVWSAGTIPFAGSRVDIGTFTNNLFIIARSNALATSTDGITWTTRAYPLSSNTPKGICFGNSTYVLTGNAGLATSTDTITWTTRLPPNNMNVCAFGNSIFVGGDSSGNIATSTDGITWTTRASNFGATGINTIAFGNGIFVAGGAGGTLRTSTDGITWTSRNPAIGLSINGVAYGNGQWVAVGGTSGTPSLATSTNGLSWTTRTITTGAVLSTIGAGPGVFVAAGASGGVITSTDGITWTQRATPNSAQSTTIFYGKGRLFVGTESSLINSGVPTNFSIYSTLNATLN